MSGLAPAGTDTQAGLPATIDLQDRAVHSTRRYDIDWLRVLTIAGVFFFHNARFFDPMPWHVKNPEKTVAALVFVGLLDCFQMPLMMLVAGAGSWFALRSKTGGRYLWDRVLRLVIPLYTVGLLILIPPQYYWELVTNKGFAGSFWQSLPKFADTFNFSPSLGFLSFWPGHLWFLRDLFLISLLTLPVLLVLRSKPGRWMLERLAAACDRPGGVFFFVIPLALLQLATRMTWPGGHPLIQFFYLMTFFLIGYCLMASDRFTRTLQRHALACLALGILCFLSMAYWVLGLGFNPWEMKRFSGIEAGFTILQSLNTWMWIAAFLGLAGRYLNFNNKVLAYANEAVLPFYALHQTIILAIGWFVVPWPLGMATKYLIISSSSLLAIMAAYELLVRRLNFVRFLFGMRLISRRPAGVVQMGQGKERCGHVGD
ncbi:MAG: acyltransferase family protein [Bacillota bacterium]